MNVYDQRDSFLRVGGLVIDQSSTQVYLNGRWIQLTPTQFRLLRHLALNVGRVVEYQELLQEIGRPLQDKELLKAYIYQIRRKLNWAPHEYLQSARGFGYMLITPP